MKMIRLDSAVAGFGGAVMATILQFAAAYALFAMQGSAMA